MPLLEVRICGARNLKDTQVFGKIDPFCTVDFEGKKWHTEQKPNTTNPEWNADFKFHVSDENSSRLHFTVWDKNPVSDDFLGEYHYAISGLERGRVDDKWVLLQQCKGNAELHIQVTAVDFGKLPQGQPQVAGYPQQQPGYPPQQPGYPPQQQGYPQQGGYPPQQGGYPPQQGGYPPQQQGYPPQQGGYPPQQQGYPPQQGGYPPQQGGYPPQQQQHHHHHHEQHGSAPYFGLEHLFGRPVYLRTHHGTVVRAHAGRDAVVDIKSNTPAEWERFVLEPHPNGTFAIRTHHGTWVRGNAGGEGAKIDTQPDGAREWEEWHAEPAPGGQGWYFLRSHHGTRMRCFPGPDGSRVDLQSNNPGEWERINIVPA
jgi:hypothetical protein